MEIMDSVTIPGWLHPKMLVQMFLQIPILIQPDMLGEVPMVCYLNPNCFLVLKTT